MKEIMANVDGRAFGPFELSLEWNCSDCCDSPMRFPQARSMWRRDVAIFSFGSERNHFAVAHEPTKIYKDARTTISKHLSNLYQSMKSTYALIKE